MCIIIYNSKGKLDSHELQTASKANPDGAGLMYAVHGKLIVFKDRKNQKTIEMYFKVRKTYPNIPIVLHFRISTDGGVNTENCHPYSVNKDIAVCHNGILTKYTGKQTDKSDTRIFIDDLLKPFATEIIWTVPFMRLVEQAISFGNKFVLMNNKGESYILNESLGHWDKKKENWYSNSSYKPTKVYQSSLPYTTNWDWKNRKTDNKFKETTKCAYCGTPLYSEVAIERGSCPNCHSILTAGDDRYWRGEFYD